MMLTAIKSALPILLLATATAFAAEPAAERPPPAAAPTTSSDASPAVDTSASPAVDTSQPTAAPARRAQNDRLDLDTTIVTGNRELPKVLYIVPWKKADLGDLPAQPFNTLLDEVLTPVDRDVFRREVTYYGVVSSGGNPSAAAPATADGAASAPARGDEK
jgi:hypothetical protein